MRIAKRKEQQVYIEIRRRHPSYTEVSAEVARHARSERRRSFVMLCSAGILLGVYGVSLAIDLADHASAWSQWVAIACVLTAVLAASIVYRGRFELWRLNRRYTDGRLTDLLR